MTPTFPGISTFGQIWGTNPSTPCEVLYNDEATLQTIAPHGRMGKALVIWQNWFNGEKSRNRPSFFWLINSFVPCRCSLSKKPRAAAVTKAAELTSQEMGCSWPWFTATENPGIPRFGIGHFRYFHIFSWTISTKIVVNQQLWRRLAALCCAVIT